MIMKNITNNLLAIFTYFCVFLCFCLLANSQTKSPDQKINQKETVVSKHAKGTFEVKVTPQPAEANVGDPTIGRLSLDKQFSGDLIGNSKGQMLGISTAIKDSAGYVAAERFTGTLDGKKGSFSLQHSGTMRKGKFELNVTVVPDSGTDELVGLSGKMTIKIVDGKHFYEFEYTIEKPN